MVGLPATHRVIHTAVKGPEIPGIRGPYSVVERSGGSGNEGEMSAPVTKKHRPLWRRVALGIVAAVAALVSGIIVATVLGSSPTIYLTSFVVAIVVGVLIFLQN